MRQRYGAAVIGVALLGVSSGCQSLEKAPAAPGVRVIIPVDDRPTQQALTAPPAISGGTLTVTLDGRFAVAADPDRDRVSVVELATGSVQQVALEAGDEPGRVVVDGASHAYVALRRAGDIASVDLSNASIDGRTHVCSAPRGMAFDWDASVLHVACADGHLVTLKPATGEVVRDLTLDTDLRDVLVHGDHLLVSTFKKAELLTVDDTGVIAERSGAAPFFSDQIQVVPSDDNNSLSGTPTQQPMTAHLAWRMTQNATGEVFMLHQGESQGVIDISKPGGADASHGGASPYGGAGGGCGAIVSPALTQIDAQGVTHSSEIASGVLSVDMAVSALTGQVAIVQAGQVDPSAPRTSIINDGSEERLASPPFPATAPSVFPASTDFNAMLPKDIDSSQISQSQVSFPASSDNDPGPMQRGNCQFAQTLTVPGQATAVAFTPTGDMVVQSREPALLTFVPAVGLPSQLPPSGLGLLPPVSATAPAPTPSLPPNVFSLGGASMRDTGHEIFHRDAGGGIACASCHAEGAEDGHTWQFTGLGKRRTQALHVGLEGTEPFHWGGDEVDLGHVMEDVFVARMGGVHQGTARLGALSDWLFSLRPPTAITSADDAAAVRGKVLFESQATGCTECHAGAKLTNNKTVDVGTGGKFQVPSLIGVGYRAPLMHTGCAATLADRFNPECGGTRHGKTDQLNDQSIGDVVAYLQTL